MSEEVNVTNPVEEDFADQFAGRQAMPWRIEDAAEERGANYIQAWRFKAYAVRDGRLIADSSSTPALRWPGS